MKCRVQNKQNASADIAFSASLARGASALTDRCLTFHIFEHVCYCHVTGALETLQLSSASEQPCFSTLDANISTFSNAPSAWYLHDGLLLPVQVLNTHFRLSADRYSYHEQLDAAQPQTSTQGYVIPVPLLVSHDWRA